MRSDSIIPKIKEKAIELLETTTLSCTEIGTQLGCSRGPIYTILKKYNVNRNKYFRNKMKKCKYCNKECYTAWQKSDANK